MNAARGTAPTVAWLLTPPGTGAVAVVSLAGPRAREILKGVFQPAGGPGGQPGRDEIVFGKLADEVGVIDDGLVAASQAGGPWQVEINTHGSWRVLQRLMTRLGELGAEVVGGGGVGAGDAEVGAAGVEGDALGRDLWATLARCRTRRAVHFVTTASVGLRDWLERLSRQADSAEADWLRAECASMLANYQANRALVEGVRVALLGPPNAGKSTLANRLYARQASLESPLPGTTRDWVEEWATLGSVPIQVVDTAGLGEPGQALEDEAVRRGLLRSEQADFRWFVVDPQAELSAQARHWLAGWEGDRRTFLLVNKIDLPGAGEPAWSIGRAWAANTIRISARNGEGIELLEELFLERLGLSPIRAGAAGLICQRQAESVGFALARREGSEAARAVAARLITDLRGGAGIK